MSQNLLILILRYCQMKLIISLFFIVFAFTENAISREPLAKSPCGFHQIKAYIITKYKIQNKTKQKPRNEIEFQCISNVIFKQIDSYKAYNRFSF